jgi:hypothetical protein
MYSDWREEARRWRRWSAGSKDRDFNKQIAEKSAGQGHLSFLQQIGKASAQIFLRPAKTWIMQTLLPPIMGKEKDMSDAKVITAKEIREILDELDGKEVNEVEVLSGRFFSEEISSLDYTEDAKVIGVEWCNKPLDDLHSTVRDMVKQFVEGVCNALINCKNSGFLSQIKLLRAYSRRQPWIRAGLTGNVSFEYSKETKTSSMSWELPLDVALQVFDAVEFEDVKEVRKARKPTLLK